MSQHIIFKVAPVAAFTVFVANLVAAQTVLEANIVSSLSDKNIKNVKCKSVFYDYVSYSEKSIES
jgi:hypothetical protein